MALFSPTLRAQIVKELLCILRDPKARFILVGPPILQLVIFSFAVTLEVRNATIAVYDRDGGRASEELVNDLRASSFIGRIVPLEGPAEIRRAIEQRRVLLALEIPETFSRDVAAGRPAELQAIVDGRRANSGQITLGYVQSIAARFGAKARRAGAAPGPPAGESQGAVVRYWFNPNLVDRWFIVPSLSGILAMVVSLLVTALSIARERELGTFDQLLVSPATPSEIIVAKVVPALLLGTALGMFMVAAAHFGFGIPFTGSLAALVACMVLFILSVVGIGLMISSVCSTQQQAILGTFATMVPMILMSGFATPVENMPRALQVASDAIPLKHFLLIVQGCFLKALPAEELLRRAAALAGIAAVTLTAAGTLVKSKLQ